MLLGSLLLFSGSGLAVGILSLRVVDAEGAPVANAVIELHGVAPQNPSGVLQTMDQVNKQFAPQVLPIQAGESVQFPNSDNIRHHVYSFSASKSFELKLYGSRPEAPVDFPTPGVVVLGCNIHDSMVGYIYVAESAVVAKTGQDGRAQFASPQNAEKVSLWHPYMAQSNSPPRQFDLRHLQQSGDGTYQLSLGFTLPPYQTPDSADTGGDTDKFKSFDF